MITSIKVNGSTISKGIASLQGSGNVDIGLTGSSVNISVNKSTSNALDPYYAYLSDIESGRIKFPYVAQISGVSPTSTGNIWILGDISSGVSQTNGSGQKKNHTLYVSDVGQTVDYPRIYRSIYEMLRQIRIWIDAHKDSLLLKNDNANKAWDTMLSPNEDWSPDVPSDYAEWSTGYREYRSRGNLVGSDALPEGSNLLGEYFGVVALWNYIVGLPDSVLSARLHPADSAGVYIGASISVPITSPETTTIDIHIKAVFSGQTDGNYIPEGVERPENPLPVVPPTLWARMPVAFAVPGNATVTSSINHNTVDPVISEGTVGGAPLPSDSVDKEGILTTTGVEFNSNTIEADISVVIQSTGIRNSYLIQAVLEIIPFFKCSSEETDYTESRKHLHYNSIGSNTWDITATVQRNSSVIQRLNTVKRTPHMTVCYNQMPAPEEQE